MSSLTPDDVAAIRAENAAHGSMRQCHELALCDALEAAWAERAADSEEWIGVVRRHRERAERAEADHAYAVDQWRAWRERAERAEAEKANVQRDITYSAKHYIHSLVAKFEAQTAALARVRALCDQCNGSGDNYYPCHCWRIRAAIEGDNQ